MQKAYHNFVSTSVVPSSFFLNNLKIKNAVSLKFSDVLRTVCDLRTVGSQKTCLMLSVVLFQIENVTFLQFSGNLICSSKVLASSIVLKVQ